MRKDILLLMTAAALLAVACDPDENGPDYPTPNPGASYVFEGTVDSPGFTWSTNSSIGIYSSTKGVTASNKLCKIQGWADTELVDSLGQPVPYTPSPYEGQSVARFDSPALDLVAGRDTFFVYSPYDAELSYSRGKIYGLEIAEEQTQPRAGVAGDSFSFGTCSGIPGQDSTFKFTLKPVSAVAKVTVTSTEYAGYGLSKVTIWDDAGQAALGGGFNVDVNANAFQSLTTYHKVSTAITATQTFQSVAEQSAYLNILPGTFSGLTFVVELKSDKGTVTIPVKKSEAFTFTGGQTTEIRIEGLKASDCTLAWYCPEETRMQSGLGYAYGDANTYLIQCKNGSTYTGATYTPNADIPDEVTIDYRARGDFFKATDPTGVTFDWFRMPKGTIYATRTAGYESSGVTVTEDDWTITPDPATYTVKVKNNGSFAGAPILVMKKDGKTLWAWAFWNIAADGTTLETVKVGEYDLANMDLGQATTRYDTWIANKAGANPDANPDVIFRTTWYYQWGRTMPLFWTTYWSSDFVYYTNYTSSQGRNVPAIEGPLTLELAMQNPVGLIVAYPLGENLPHWDAEENRAALWGGNAKGHADVDGTKAIYDPCPKGWRVADANALVALSETTPTSWSNTAGKVGFLIGESLFPTQGYLNGKLASDKADNRVSTMGGGNTGTVGGCGHGLLWSNYLGSDKSNQPKAYYYRPEANKSDCRMATYNASTAAVVRCQVDTDNR